MPQATEEDRKQWGGECGVGEDKALDFLLNRGWKQLKNGFMIPPTDEVPWEEFDAMMFLIFEWDFACGKAITVIGYKKDAEVPTDEGQ